MSHIFISYSHKDKNYVHKLQKALQDEGFEVWIDDRIDYGTEWPTIIQKHLDDCDAFIVVLTENAFKSKWVQNEVARASRKEKYFFPLLLQGDPWLSVEATQYVDVTDGSLPPEKFYERLEMVTHRFKEKPIPIQNASTTRAISKQSNDYYSKRRQKAIIFFIGLLLTLIAVVIGALYTLPGKNNQYSDNFSQAQVMRSQAVLETDPASERKAWEEVLFYLDKAEAYGETSESQALRNEVQAELDQLEGIQRLGFYPAFTTGIGVQISRLAANETDLYILDAEQGRVLHAAQVGRSFEMDAAFRCEQGDYGEYHVGPIVDILILPRLNSMNAAVLGIDAGGTLLYCAPGQVGQAIPLPIPDTNWGRVTGFTYDSGNLYVLDAPSRAVWVYTGQDASFIDRPYFFFGGQIPEIEDSIDLVVNGDELYLLHADSHLSHCSYSRLDTVPTRCEDPVTLVNTIPAYKDIDLFGQAHITQMMLTLPPDVTLLLLDADNRNVMRFSPRSLELMNQIYPMPGTSFKPGPAGAMTVHPNRVLFLAVGDQIYFATDMP